MSFLEFIEQCWNDHADHAQDVADRLAAALPMVAAPEDIAAFARIVTHVYGEHLGEWARGIALLDPLRNVDGYTAEAGVVVTRSLATLRYAGGDPRALRQLGNEDRAAVLATAAAAFTGRKDLGRALEAYGQAVQLASGLPKGSSAFRTLAIGGNNLAEALEAVGERDQAQTEGMIAAARGALTFWRLAGTWIEEERALYRLTRSLLAAKMAEEAVETGVQCVKVCLANEAPAFERFFAYAVLASALRQAERHIDYADMREEAMAWFDRVAEGERQWCESDLADLAY
ncbi:MAG: hypothetical protein IT518_18910 [Burkholderiales bacterium]|nr:hypothetical protein [Burkholderiales bacterium]